MQRRINNQFLITGFSIKFIQQTLNSQNPKPALDRWGQEAKEHKKFEKMKKNGF